jgi:hypothetical protein
MLAALWVAAAQSQSPVPDRPPTAGQTPTAQQPAAPTVAQQGAGATASTSSSPKPAGAQQAAAAAATPDNAAPTMGQRAAASPPAEPAPEPAPESTSQSQAPVQTTADTAPTPDSTSTPSGATPRVTPRAAAAPAADVAQATGYLKAAAADFTNCRRPSACNVYFDTFGVAIPFADGSIVPFSHVQRLTATSRECIKKAKALEEEGNRSLAVQWAMAARIENRSVRDWLGNHPDAVLEALRQVIVP